HQERGHPAGLRAGCRRRRVGRVVRRRGERDGGAVPHRDGPGGHGGGPVSVTEVRQALGSWQLSLVDGTPADVLDAVTPFGHVVVLPGRMTAGDVQAAGDALLSAAR